MDVTGKCYCGALEYKVSGEPLFRGQCHCRECQYMTGGHPLSVMGMPDTNFEYTKGEAASFTRSDIPNPVTRQFCANCGTHTLTNLPAMSAVLLKVGTMDDPSLYGKPDMAIFTCDAQEFHVIPDGIPAFEKMPPTG